MLQLSCKKCTATARPGRSTTRSHSKLRRITCRVIASLQHRSTAEQRAQHKSGCGLQSRLQRTHQQLACHTPNSVLLVRPVSSNGTNLRPGPSSLKPSPVPTGQVIWQTQNPRTLAHHFASLHTMPGWRSSSRHSRQAGAALHTPSEDAHILRMDASLQAYLRLLSPDAADHVHADKQLWVLINNS